MKHFPLLILTFFIVNLCLFAMFSPSMCQQQFPPIDLTKVKTAQLPYRLEIEKVLTTLENEIFIPADLNNDGEDEMILKKTGEEKPNFISLKSIQDNRVKFQKNFYGQIVSDPAFFDLDNDGTKEIIFSERKNDTTYVHALNSEGALVFSFEGECKPDVSIENWDCVINASASIDINDDGWLDLLLIVHTGYAYQPRGLFAYDVRNKRYIWKYKTGFHVLTPTLIDINNDGQREILLGSSAPDNSNGILVNETDDRHTYLTVLDLHGNFLSNQTIGYQYGQANISIHDLNGDSKPEILVNFNSHRDPKEMSFVALWNPMTGNLSPQIPMEKDLSENIVFLDADRNGKDDFLIGWSGGTIEIRDYNFEVIISRKFPGFDPKIFAILDLNNDGEEEIIVSGKFKGYPKLIIINRKLELLACPDANVSLPGQNCFLRTGFGMEKLLLAKIGAETVLMSLKKQIWIFPLTYWRWIGYGIIIGMLLTGLVLTLLMTKRYRSINTMKLNYLINTLQEGLIILDAEGNIIAMNRAMEELITMNREDVMGFSYKTVLSDSVFKEPAQAIHDSYQGKPISIEKEITIFHKNTTCNFLMSIGPYSLGRRKDPGRLITIRNITEMVQSKRAIAWASLAQKLAHEIKTPLSTVMLTAQRLQLEYENKPAEAQKVGKYLSNIIDQVHCL